MFVSNKDTPHIFFDIDDVLIPDSKSGPGYGYNWAKEFCEFHKLHALFLEKNFFTPYFKDVLTGKINLEEKLDQIFATAGLPRGSSAQMIKMWFEEENNFNNSLVRSLKCLKKEYLLHIASNQSVERMRYIESVWPYSNVFYSNHISSKIGFLKNDRHFFQAVNNKLPGIKKILIDDSFKNIEACEKEGWLGIHYTSIASINSLLKE